MKKTRRGITLVEVIVSIAVFTIISLALFSSVLAMRKVVLKQEQFARLEMVCHDINAYWDAYGEEWADAYFKGNANDKFGFLDADFEPVENTKAYFVISYDIVENEGKKELVIKSIYLDSTKFEFATNINCGERGVNKNEAP